MGLNKKNAYFCQKCHGYLVTIDIAEGVTPMFLACRVKGERTDPANDCDGAMISMMYPDEPWPDADGFGHPIPTEPTWEWYKPDDAEYTKLDAIMQTEHVDRGGLLLRKRT